MEMEEYIHILRTQFHHCDMGSALVSNSEQIGFNVSIARVSYQTVAMGLDIMCCCFSSWILAYFLIHVGFILRHLTLISPNNFLIGNKFKYVKYAPLPYEFSL